MIERQPRERLFTVKGLVLGTLLSGIYAVVLFSTDPEWVAWAGPMAMGALYVPNTPPPLFAHPEAAFEMASRLSALSLTALVVLTVFRRETPLGWWSSLKTWFRKQLELDVKASSRSIESPGRDGNV